MKEVITTEDGHEVCHIVLEEEVTFFNKAQIIQALGAILANSKMIIDCTRSKSTAYYVIKFIQDYKNIAKLKNVTVETVGFIESA